MAYKFQLVFEGQINLISDNESDLKRQLDLIVDALKRKAKLGLDFGIKTTGNYWSAVFFDGDNLSGNFSISVQKKIILAKGDITISVYKLPPKVGKLVKSNEYTIELGGFYLDGEGFIAKESILVKAPTLVLV